MPIWIKSVLGPLAIGVSIFANGTAFAQDDRERGNRSSDLRGEVSASAIIASDRGDEEDNDRSGARLRAELDYQQDIGRGEIRLGYDSSVYFYEDGDRPDQWTNRLSLAYAVDVAQDLELSAQVSYASNLSTLEFRSADQVETTGTVEYSPGRHRLRLFGGWRWRDYDDEARSEGNGAIFGAGYRYRLAQSRFLSAGFRFEDIDSDNPRRGYERTTIEAYYQHPLALRSRLRVGAAARFWDFDGRLTPDGDRRRDSAVIPEIDVLYGFASGFLLQGRLQYGLRSSNDPAFRADDQRAILTAGYKF